MSPVHPGHRQSFHRSNYFYGNGFRGRVRCESRGNRVNSCHALTQRRVVITRVNGGRCGRGDWGYDSRRIWVTRNCRATFSYGFGRYYPSRWNSRSSSRDAAFFIGGAAVATGLIAILSNSGRSVDSSGAQSLPPAAISADPNWVTEAARPALQQCLSRAARDVGLTGGNRITLRTASAYSIESDAFQIAGTLSAEYPDGTRELPMLCEATATSLDNFEFAS